MNAFVRAYVTHVGNGTDEGRREDVRESLIDDV